MKKYIIPFLLCALAAVSCLKSSYSSSYPLYADFEYENIPFDNDSICRKQTMAGNVVFLNKTTETGFGGLALSHAKNIHFEDCIPHSVYDTVAANRSDVFMLFHANPGLMPEHHIYFNAASMGTCLPVGCMVHNTTAVAKAIKEGDSKFERGDWLKLKATGYLNGNATGSAEIMLADFSEKDSLITTWTFFDLQKVGNFEYLDFELSSSKENIPQYFCMDNFCATISISN